MNATAAAAATNSVRPARSFAESSADQSWEGLASNIVIDPAGLAEWQSDAVKKVLSFKALPANWDSYGSPQFGRAALQGALNLIFSCREVSDYFPAPRIVPVSGGGIQFEWSNGSREVAIEVRPDGDIETLKVQDGMPLDEGEGPFTSVPPSLIAWLFSR